MSPLLRSIIMAAIATLPAGAVVDFAKDLVPVLEQKSLSCHNPNFRKGDLSEILDFDEEMIVKGRHTESLLYQVVITEPGDEEPEMPKREKP
jgi:hypothetical protein